MPGRARRVSGWGSGPPPWLLPRAWFLDTLLLCPASAPAWRLDAGFVAPAAGVSQDGRLTEAVTWSGGGAFCGFT